ncbi:ABC transporter ATP-binding protein [Nitratireductor aquibiodomus]|uniref:ABC transporter ATP-binding protein n=1 Tax=Nitratireductor aquibiodomus TaxID=204799 RepID=UPI00046A1D36|nr:ABC transporter ATP-binding protein [Nitratireductor aquibiodomus]
MSGEIALRNVSKVYRTYEKPWHRLAEIASGGRRDYGHDVRALGHVSLDLQKGDRLGVVGENGSGKSTLLKIITGVLTPSTGTVSAGGRISALLELGAGFNASLSGRENIEAFSLIHGLSVDEARDAVPKIIAFSEIGEFIDYPVNTYSSGMAVRLGFACAVFVRPDILIVDEALSVGDAYFQNKCLHKIKSMLDEGVTFIYVTHMADSVRALCNKGLWLDQGRQRAFGSATEVGELYKSAVFEKIVAAEDVEARLSSKDCEEIEDATVVVDPSREEAFRTRVEALRTGSLEVEIVDISFPDSRDSFELDDNIVVRVHLKHNRPAPKECALAIGVTDGLGRQILHFSSAVQGLYLDEFAAGSRHCVEFRFKNVLCPGEYGIVGGIAPLSKHPQSDSLSTPKHVVDYCVGGARFSVGFPTDGIKRDLWGVVHTSYEVTQVA